MIYEQHPLTCEERRVTLSRARKTKEFIRDTFFKYPYLEITPTEFLHRFKPDSNLFGLRPRFTELINEGFLERTVIKIPSDGGGYEHRVRRVKEQPSLGL